MDRRAAAVTLADVAAAAGVSVGTASKALNGRGQLREQTRTRVEAAADRLGFRANSLARGLVSGRSFTVGLITTDSFGRFTLPVLLGAEDALGSGQMSVFLCDGRGDPIREQHYLRGLLSRKVDGVLVTGRRSDPRPPIGRDLPIPVVYAFSQSEDGEDCSLISDDRQAGALAVGHLIATGRSRIAHITGPEDFLAVGERAAGALDALGHAGLSLRGPGVLYGSWSEAWGRQGMQMVLHADPSVDSVFCGSDQVARGAVDAAQAAGRSVPGDIAVIGVDNWEPMAAGCRPPLSTVDLRLEAMGRQAAGHLLAAIDGHAAHGVHRLPGRLVVREST